MSETTGRTPRNTAGAIAKAAAGRTVAKSNRATMQGYIAKMTPEIIKGLPKHISSDRFIRTIYSAISANPKLAECTPESFLAAMMGIVQNGLEANTQLGQAWIIPYYNSREKIYEAQVQIGYRGLLELAYRSGSLLSVQVQEVRENDDFSYQLGLRPDLRHVPARSNRGEVTDYYAVLNFRDGGFIFEVMSVEEIREHSKRFSKAGASSPWTTNFSSMAKKTVLKKALKYAPLSAEVQRQFSADETVKTEISADMSEISGRYVLDEDTGEIIQEVQEVPEAAEAETPAESAKVVIDV